ncbi:MAG: hypothetical protein PHH16_03440 [Candidatus Gracilibacteria bacterium]|nr:hypothetical protein [Candidatus Gracilibacteria bacterium]
MYGGFRVPIFELRLSRKIFQPVSEGYFGRNAGTLTMNPSILEIVAGERTDGAEVSARTEGKKNEEKVPEARKKPIKSDRMILVRDIRCGGIDNNENDNRKQIGVKKNHEGLLFCRIFKLAISVCLV